MSSLDTIKSDLKDLVSTKNCGPILIRLNWHDAGVYSTGSAIGNEVYATGAEAEHTDLDVDLPIKEVENDEILIDTSPDKVVGKVEAEEGGVDMKQDDDRDSEDDDSSLNDFPEIVDEDPDEEDRM